jgi:hypothetical protein
MRPTSDLKCIRIPKDLLDDDTNIMRVTLSTGSIQLFSVGPHRIQRDELGLYVDFIDCYVIDGLFLETVGNFIKPIKITRCPPSDFDWGYVHLQHIRVDIFIAGDNRKTVFFDLNKHSRNIGARDFNIGIIDWSGHHNSLIVEQGIITMKYWNK